MQGLGSVKRKRKKAKGHAPAKRRKKRSVSGVGAIAGTRRRRRRRSVGAVVGVKRRRRRSSLGRVRASTRRHKRHARGLGSITGGNKYVNAAIKVAEIAAGMLLSAAATTAFFKNADPEKDKKMKKLRGPVAVVAGLALSFLMKNPHLENIGVGIAAHGVLRAIGDLILVDKKDKLGLGITDDSMHGNDTVGELSLFGDPASLFGTELLFGDPASLFGYPEMGELPLASPEDRFSGYQVGAGELPLASPEDRFSGYQVGAGELTPMQGLSGPFEEVYARANGKYVQRLNGVIASLSN